MSENQYLELQRIVNARFRSQICDEQVLNIVNLSFSEENLQDSGAMIDRLDSSYSSGEYLLLLVWVLGMLQAIGLEAGEFGS